MTTANAYEIQALLRQRHTGDVYVAECKDGATTTRRHKQLDGWAMLKTWSPVTFVGYEVKASRSDWLRDQKMDGYLPLAHLFYIAAAKGVVRLEELPDSVGLLEALGEGTGRRLVCKQKARRREVDVPTHLLLYVLMYRAEITASQYGRSKEEEAKADRIANWQEWVDQRNLGQVTGCRVKGRIHEVIEQALRAKRDADHRAEQFAEAASILSEMGINAATTSSHTLRRRVEAELRKEASATVADLNQTIERLAVLRNRIETATQQPVAMEAAS